MNTYSKSILAAFNSQKNKDALRQSLCAYFNNDIAVTRFLDDNFGEMMRTFTYVLSQDMYMSDPIMYISTEEQVACFNKQFMNDKIKFISDHVLRDERVPLYRVGDNLRTSRYDYNNKPDDLLAAWRSNSARGIQSREDPSNYAPINSPLSSGITFCDQSEIGLQRHHDLFFGSLYMRELNKTDRGWERTPFGYSTPESDARLLERRNFRSNEIGVENGIPRYESRLYARNIDHDIRDGITGTEKTNILLRHDMGSLRRRVDYKNNIARKFTC